MVSVASGGCRVGVASTTNVRRSERVGALASRAGCRVRAAPELRATKTTQPGGMRRLAQPADVGGRRTSLTGGACRGAGPYDVEWGG